MNFKSQNGEKFYILKKRTPALPVTHVLFCIYLFVNTRPYNYIQVFASTKALADSEELHTVTVCQGLVQRKISQPFVIFRA